MIGEPVSSYHQPRRPHGGAPGASDLGERPPSRRRGAVCSALVAPSGMPKIPRLQMSVLESPFRELVDKEFCSSFVIGCARDAGAVSVGKDVQSTHQLRMFGFFALDARGSGFVYLLLRKQESAGAEGKQQLFHIGSG